MKLIEDGSVHYEDGDNSTLFIWGIHPGLLTVIHYHNFHNTIVDEEGFEIDWHWVDQWEGSGLGLNV